MLPARVLSALKVMSAEDNYCYRIGQTDGGSRRPAKLLPPVAQLHRNCGRPMKCLKVVGVPQVFGVHRRHVEMA